MSWPDNAGTNTSAGTVDGLPATNVGTPAVDNLQPNSIGAPANSSSLAMLGFGSVVKSFGAISSGVSQINSFAQKAATDRYNAGVQTNNAASIGAETAANEQQLRMYSAQKIGQQRANLAEAGIGPISEGSAGDAINQSEVNANMQALTERFKGNVQRTNALNSAQLDRYYAKVADENETSAEFATGASATASMLSGATKFAQAF